MIYDMTDERYNDARSADGALAHGSIATNTPLSMLIDCGRRDIRTPTGLKVSNGVILSDSSDYVVPGNGNS